jgi:hypothetical protein
LEQDHLRVGSQASLEAVCRLLAAYEPAYPKVSPREALERLAVLRMLGNPAQNRVAGKKVWQDGDNHPVAFAYPTKVSYSTAEQCLVPRAVATREALPVKHE